VRYFKYRPENLAPFATTTIFPSSLEIVILSPKLPVRLSTLILSWRNFSKAAGSKILSLVGADASRTYYFVSSSLLESAYFLRLLLCGDFAGFLRRSAYCFCTAKLGGGTYCLLYWCHLDDVCGVGMRLRS